MVVVLSRAYGSDEIREYIIQYHATYVILPQTQYKRTLVYGLASL